MSAQIRLENFLKQHSQVVDIAPLTPDASLREYFRVNWNNQSAIACVYPFDDFGKNQFSACLDVTDVFLSSNLPVAEIFASDAEQGIIIHDDFGDKILRDFLIAETTDEKTRETYLNKAITLIAEIQNATKIAVEQNSVSSKLKFDYEKLAWEFDFFTKHYFTSLQKSPLDETDAKLLKNELDEVANELADNATVLTHRDFHAANMMLQNGEIKIIDHQDARLGTTSYDLVSLLLDRVTTLPTPEWLAEKRRFFLDQRERLGLEKIDKEQFAHEFRLQTIQRCLKAIGTFANQIANRDKETYRQYIIPMFKIVLRACENLDRFPNLQRIIKRELKLDFKKKLSKFVLTLESQVSTDDKQWTIKGFIDVFQNIYTISTDTKIVSKILEIHLFSHFLEFAKTNNYKIVLTEHQNYYPDLSFVDAEMESIKFAVDLKTTYRLPEKQDFCNGFTLGSHGEYFINRNSTKNIQFPYCEYLGHFCLGVIYSRNQVDETKLHQLNELKSITSVIKDLQFFVREKWEIASDSSGSGNTANIGSIKKIEDILSGNGIFKNLGEEMFDDFWINYGKITITEKDGKLRKITKLKDFLEYRGKSR
jgi:aminoglycoside/choline kinase family phosphotransferase